MFLRILSGSLRHQRRRLAIAALAMVLGSSLVSGLLNLSGDIGGQVGRELRTYGANIVVLPRASSVLVGSGNLEFGEVAAEQTLPEEILVEAREVEGVMGLVPYLYSVVDAGGQAAVLAGVDIPFAREINKWWQVQGKWPQADNEILLGARAAEVLGASAGNSLTLTYGKQKETLKISGVLRTGGAEDEQIIASLRAAQNLTGQPGQIGLAMVSALTSNRSLDEIAQDLRTRISGRGEVRTLTQFALAERTVLNKVRLLIGLVAGLVLATGALTVAGTLNIIVEERRTEIGLMKAIGAQNRRVAGLFLFEAASIGLAGGVSGYVLGVALAFAVSRTVFDATITPAPLGFPVTTLIALTIALFASMVPVQKALAVDPVKTLRGE